MNDQPNTTTWLVEPDRLPLWLRWPFKAMLVIVFVWFMAQTLCWLGLGALNPEPFPEASHVAFLVAMSAWAIAIAIRWGYSLYAK